MLLLAVFLRVKALSLCCRSSDDRSEIQFDPDSFVTTVQSMLG